MGGKWRFAWVDCIEPLCESAARNNIVEDEVAPNKFILADCRVKAKEERPLFDGRETRNISYTVIDGGKMSYPTDIRDRIKACNVTKTPWARGGSGMYSGILMRPPSCAIKASVRLQ